MLEFPAIRVHNFSGRKKEWPSVSKKCLAKAKRSGKGCPVMKGRDS
jgi:hypothetical protein